MRWFWHFLLKLMNWKIEGNIPAGLDKYILAVAPHTSNWDFLLGVIVRGVKGFHSNYLGKASLFKPPFGFVFKALGGIAVDRSKRSNIVDQVVAEVKKREKFGLAIAPEGTRKQVNQWKTGFYYIAVKAGIPIIPVQLDWGNRVVRFLEPLYPSGDINRELPEIQSKFEHIRGKTDIIQGI